MEKRRLGHTNIDVSCLCLGTMMYGDQMDEAEAFAQMDACIDRGINFFDTAEMYTVPPKPETRGHSERIVGDWIKKRGMRDRVVLASKVVGRSPMLWIRENEDETRLTRAQIFTAIDRSLDILQTDYLDLYQLHWPDRKIAVFGGKLNAYRHYDDDYTSYEEILDALKDIQKAGKVRHFGLSNETPYGTMRFLQSAKDNDTPRMQSIQNAYNLLNRSFETGLAEIAIEEKIGLLAYSPMAQGVLSGKYLNGGNPKGSRGEMYGRLNRYQTPAAEKSVKAYVDLAKELGVDPSALANQFVTTRSFVTSNIFGARTMAQLETVWQSLEIEWTKELDKAVDAIHAQAPNPCP